MGYRAINNISLVELLFLYCQDPSCPPPWLRNWQKQTHRQKLWSWKQMQSFLQERSFFQEKCALKERTWFAKAHVDPCLRVSRRYAFEPSYVCVCFWLAAFAIFTVDLRILSYRNSPSCSDVSFLEKTPTIHTIRYDMQCLPQCFKFDLTSAGSWKRFCVYPSNFGNEKRKIPTNFLTLTAKSKFCPFFFMQAWYLTIKCFVYKGNPDVS